VFGSDSRADRDATELDPAIDAAKIRAFFIHPDFARRGLGTRLLERCEEDAIAHGFHRLELMATLPGVRLYAARGYQGTSTIDWPLGDGLSIRFLPMNKPAPPSPYRIERASRRRRRPPFSACRNSPTSPRHAGTTTGTCRR
jgi:GNAT superfamily N-acetyltransferase